MSMRKAVITAALMSMIGAVPATAGQQERDIIHEQCGVQLNQPPAVCDCISSSAGEQLNEDQQAFMAAQISSNAPEIARSQALLDQNEALGVMTFMTTVIADCGGG